MFLSTGEVSLAAKLEEDQRKAKAGQEIRLLDIEADAGRGHGCFDSEGSETSAAALAEAITAAAAECYGTAGPALLAAIASQGTDATKAIIVETITAFMKETGSGDGQMHRAAQRLGLIAAAGELAIRLGIVPWQEGSAFKAARFAFERWLTGRGGSEAAEAMAAVRQVRLFIEKFGDSRFEDLDNPGVHTIPNRAGWRKGRGDEQVWLVPPETWKSEVCSGLDPKLTARVLGERGMLDRADDGFQKVQWVSSRSTRCYTITAKIFDPDSVLTLEKGVRDVSGVNKGLLESGLTCQNANETSGLTCLTSLTCQNQSVGKNSPEYDDIPDFLDRRPATQFRPGTLLTQEDEDFLDREGLNTTT